MTQIIQKVSIGRKKAGGVKMSLREKEWAKGKPNDEAP